MASNPAGFDKVTTRTQKAIRGGKKESLISRDLSDDYNQENNSAVDLNAKPPLLKHIANTTSAPYVPYGNKQSPKKAPEHHPN